MKEGWKALFFNGTYNFSVDAGTHVHPKIVVSAFSEGCEYHPVALGKANSFRALAPIERAIELHSKVVVFCGTDNIEELAFLFSLMRPSHSTVVFVGSMFPYGRSEYDGHRSVRKFLEVAEGLSSGSWVVVGDTLIDGFHVRKRRSRGLDAFGSGLSQASSYTSSHVTPTFQVRLSDVTCEVALITVALGDSLSWFSGHGLDGLVIAGSGTGSVPDAVLDRISEVMSDRPVVVSTRCMDGPNHADDLYPGSVKRYEDRGLIVRRYAGLNPLQARLKLMLEISTGRLAL
jgi:L-asparaginase